MKEKIKKIVSFIANPRLLLCFGLAWIITNGWSYILLGIGTLFEIGWMVGIASGYIAFLWLPISPEKVVTVAIAIFLLRVLFPNDQKTLRILKNWYKGVKNKFFKKKKVNSDIKGEENKYER